MSFGSVFSFVLVIFLLCQNAECCRDQNRLDETQYGDEIATLSPNPLPEVLYGPKFSIPPSGKIEEEEEAKNKNNKKKEKRNPGDGDKQKSIKMEYLWQQRFPAVVLVPQVRDTYRLLQ